jgi:hypothetical protein
MRHAAATQIRRIKALVRAGDCAAAQKRFDALVPLVGRRGTATAAGVKPKTIARLWGLVGRCRRR